MRSLFLFLFLIFSVNSTVFAQNKVSLASSYNKKIIDELKPFFTLSEGQLEDVLEGNVVSEGNVDTPAAKQQQMKLHVAGIHPRNCHKAMRKLSLYENYSDYMSFVKKSSYDEKTKRLLFNVDHTLLPFPLVVSFKLDRITKAGSYPFTFENGFLKDLQGTVIVRDLGKFCLLGLNTDWKGPETKIPNLVFSSFIQTIGKLGLEHLIRVSLY
ncbi:MAG TPA: hypothetical protein VNJ01_01445 [Bacteriovoracaceae bacterium]|nr:hypothetical protein [Bacteriovoracaceae bacterium]